MSRKHSIAAVLTLSCLTLAGCPQLDPPFDASGNYAGDFAVGLADLELIDGCGMLITLDQDIQGLPIANGKLEGTVTLTFGCVLPEDIAFLAGAGSGAGLGALGAGAGLGALGAVAGLDTPGIGGLDTDIAGMLSIPAVQVTGVLLPDGTLELNTPDFLEDCTEGDCVKLALIGKGVDVDNDGRMDWFDGTFGGTLGKDFGGLPIIGEFETSTLN